MDYGYANARIKAMKSRLLQPPVLETLINKPDLSSVITELEKTPYRIELEKASVQYSDIVLVEVALRKDMISAFRKILGFMKGDEEEEAERSRLPLILHRWDIHNIKTILRGKKISVSSEEILSCVIPAGDLDEAALIELARQPDVKAVIDLLATWGIEYAKPLTRNFKKYSEQRDMAILEYALDKFYLENTLATVKRGGTDDDRIIKNFILAEIDVTNIKTVLKMIRDKMDVGEAEKFLIKGSIGLGIDKLLLMVRSGSIEGAAKYLAGTPYNFLNQIPEKSISGESISEFEKELDRYLVKKGIRHFLGDPLSISIGLAYVWAKVNEVTNIRIIARGKTADIPDKDLREALINV
ncbi:MAG: V-type ATPase subunit [Methanomicrobiales archaeon]|nr:V-type ATPase subunit [Methanomicrobiales archaeon]